VGTIADGVLLSFDELLTELDVPRQQLAASGQAPPAEEQTLWEGRPLLSLTEYYIVTNERVRIVSGLLGKQYEDIELIRLQDVDFSQRFGERMMNIGDIALRSADASHPEITLRNVRDPAQVHETIRRAMLDARKRYRVGFRDEI
jgi:hypothetical protein